MTDSTAFKKVAASLLTATLLGGAAFYVDMTRRMALVEDDLEEAIMVMMQLHPRTPTASAESSMTILAGSKAHKKAERRQELLEQLKQQMKLHRRRRDVGAPS